MKFRILERNDGRYEVAYKKHFFQCWTISGSGSFASLNSAKDYVQEWIEENKKDIQKISGRKIKRIVEEISE